MRYFFVRYVEDLPDGAGGIAFGPFIRILSKYRHDAGLLEHEKTHVRQWYAAAAVGFLLVAVLAAIEPYAITLLMASVSNHGLLYRFARPYRKWSEVQAYRKQIFVGGYTSNEFAVIHLSEKYDLGLSADEARALLIH